MTLETYYYLSLSVAATLFSIALVVGVIVLVWLVIRLKQILTKLEQLAETSNETAFHVKTFVENTTARLIALEKLFLTAEGLKQVASQVAEAIAKRKGDSHESRSKQSKS